MRVIDEIDAFLARRMAIRRLAVAGSLPLFVEDVQEREQVRM